MVREELVGGLQAAAGRDDAIQVPVNPDASHVAGSGGIAQDLRAAEGMPRTKATSTLSPVGMDTRTPRAGGGLLGSPSSPVLSPLQAPKPAPPSLKAQAAAQHGSSTRRVGSQLPAWLPGSSLRIPPPRVSHHGPACSPGAAGLRQGRAVLCFPPPAQLRSGQGLERVLIFFPFSLG